MDLIRECLPWKGWCGHWDHHIVCNRLEARSEFDEGWLAPWPSQDFEPNGQSILGKSHGNNKRRQPGYGTQLIWRVLAFRIVARSKLQGTIEFVWVN